MSQTQEQANTNAKSEQQQQQHKQPSRQSTAIFDPMAQEELRGSFDELGEENISVRPSQGTGLFQKGMAAAFEEESQLSTPEQYEPPVSLEKIRSFFASFDFSDRSDKSKSFAVISLIHEEILSVQGEITSIRDALVGASPFVRQQIFDELSELAHFQQQAADFMEEVRPSF